MAALLVIFAILLYLFVRESMFAQVDRRLDENLSVVAETARKDLTEISEVEKHTRVLAFRVMEGDWPLYASGGWITGDLDAAGVPPGSARWIFTSARIGIYHIREIPLRADGRDLRIAVAEESSQMHESLDELRNALIASFPLALLVSMLAGYLLAGRALAPVQTLTARARALNADRLSERLSVPNPHDELGQLTAVLNDAFGRLEASFDRLKRFTHDAAHELRTPLAVLRSVGEVGLQRQSDVNGYRDVIGSMLEEVDRLGRLVDGLLTLARAESGRFTPSLERQDLAVLVNDVAACLRVLAEEKRQVLHVSAVEEATAVVDRDTMRLALINLIANAIRYTPEGGDIRIRLCRQSDQTFSIDVEDNGPGIAPEHRDRIFERFYRIEESRSKNSGGSGLGLAIARWAVAVSRGQLSLEPTSGAGSLFRIVLNSQ